MKQLKQKMSSDKKLGLFLVIVPVLGVILGFSAYAIGALFVQSMEYTEYPGWLKIFNAVLGYLTMVALVATLFGTPAGIVILITSRKKGK